MLLIGLFGHNISAYMRPRPLKQHGNGHPVSTAAADIRNIKREPLLAVLRRSRKPPAGQVFAYDALPALRQAGGINIQICGPVHICSHAVRTILALQDQHAVICRLHTQDGKIHLAEDHCQFACDIIDLIVILPPVHQHGFPSFPYVAPLRRPLPAWHRTASFFTFFILPHHGIFTSVQK